jgi:hypothetical protein
MAGRWLLIRLCQPRVYILTMLFRALPTVRSRKAAPIAANDNMSNASAWRRLWLPLLAAWALPPVIVLAGIIAAIVLI